MQQPPSSRTLHVPRQTGRKRGETGRRPLRRPVALLIARSNEIRKLLLWEGCMAALRVLAAGAAEHALGQESVHVTVELSEVSPLVLQKL